MSVSRASWGIAVVVLVCSAFALRALSLIDATGLWSDELYTVGKSFQPSYEVLLAMLRLDTHPPLYYSLVWLWGQLLPASAITLRLLSWLVYLGGDSDHGSGWCSGQEEFFGLASAGGCSGGADGLLFALSRAICD